MQQHFYLGQKAASRTTRFQFARTHPDTVDTCRQKSEARRKPNEQSKSPRAYHCFTTLSSALLGRTAADSRQCPNRSQCNRTIAEATPRSGTSGCGTKRQFHDALRHAAIAPEAANRLRDAGHAINPVSAGSSPTALHTNDASALTELRAGVYVLFDLNQQSRGVCASEVIALSVLASVIGHRQTPLPRALGPSLTSLRGCPDGLGMTRWKIQQTAAISTAWKWRREWVNAGTLLFAWTISVLGPLSTLWTYLLA
jgi:hypothetical protein